MKTISQNLVVVDSCGKTYLCEVVKKEDGLELLHAYEEYDSNKKSMAKWVCCFNLGELRTVILKKHTDYSVRNLTTEESAWMQRFVVEMDYAKKIALSKLENRYFLDMD